MAIIDIDMKPASAVFIDVPNVAEGSKWDWRTHFRWDRLSRHIAASNVLLGTELMLANAYVSNWSDRSHLIEWTKTAFKVFGRSSYQMKVRTFDDVDSLIIEDMWQVIAQREQESIREGVLTYPLRIRFILVTGDGDYARTISKMRETYGSNLELELIVYSWANCLSGRLEALANSVVQLESIHRFVKILSDAPA